MEALVLNIRKRKALKLQMPLLSDYLDKLCTLALYTRIQSYADLSLVPQSLKALALRIFFWGRGDA